MTAIGQDTLNARTTLKVGGKSYDYFALRTAEEKYGDISRLPFSMKVLLENMLRFEDGVTVTAEDIQAIVDWQKERRSDREIQYRPARVLMQDFTGVPCVVDLAAMRDAITRSSAAMPRRSTRRCRSTSSSITSVMVDEFGTPKAFEDNVELEYAAQFRTLRIPQMGIEGARQFLGRAAGDGHLPPGEPRIYRPGGVVVEERRRDDRLPRHARRHRQPHDDDQRPRRARLGRRRDRGGGGDARPARQRCSSPKSSASS